MRLLVRLTTSTRRPKVEWTVFDCWQTTLRCNFAQRGITPAFCKRRLAKLPGLEQLVQPPLISAADQHQVSLQPRLHVPPGKCEVANGDFFSRAGKTLEMYCCLAIRLIMP
mmetsp:Transcript_74697/g.120600  ORF Transcript_74697/g.120600 Transcript_74697/m.120600 type:complete len:111 (-) Transcript_74697:45-377(-)